MNKKMIKRINKQAKRAKHGMSKAKVFQATTNHLRVIKES